MDYKDWLGEDNTLGLDIMMRKYRYGDETFDEWLDRVSGNHEDVKELIFKKEFIFGGRILSNRGTPGKKTYSNCYVITPPEDNLESIFDTAKKLARTYSYGGGCGIDLAKLCPKGMKVNNAAKESTGAVSFMDLYDTTTGLIGQNGRRGALMLSMPVNHPDIKDFIKIKSDVNKINNANISVRVNDEFMEAVVKNETYNLHFERPEVEEYFSEKINARELFDEICKLNWSYAEPGILYWDTITRHNLLEKDDSFSYGGVNPCAEEPLPPGGSCCLGALNLASFVTNPFTEEADFDWNEFDKAVHVAVKALNDVLDEGLELHPLDEQKESVRDWRQIGLGMMGLADCLIMLGFTYGEDDANLFCENIASELFIESVKESERLGKELGSYPKFNAEKINKSTMLKKAGLNVEALRNSQLLTVAPTGSISTMIQVSGGIEPIYANTYTRKTQSLHGENVTYKLFTPIVKNYMDTHGIEKEEDLPEFFITSSQVEPMKRIKTQAAWQKYIDASISSTVNLPESATIEDIFNIYMEAWKQGLKGVTVFRDNCSRDPVLSTEKSEPKTAQTEKQLDYIEPVTRNELGKCLSGNTYVKNTACGKLYITINHDENGNLVEVFIDPGKSGGCVANAECLGRYASMAMRGGMKIESVIDATKGIKCSACTNVRGKGIKPIDGLSCGDIVARTILEEYEKCKKDIETPKAEPAIAVSDAPPASTPTSKCPKCGEPLSYSGGCKQCLSCGWSKCE